jgi:hypothetical protein
MAIVKKTGMATAASVKKEVVAPKKEEVGSVSYVELESTVLDPDGVVIVSEVERKSLRVAVLPQGIVPATVSLSLEEKRPTVPYGNVNGRVTLTVPCLAQEIAEVCAQAQEVALASLRGLMEELAGDFPVNSEAASGEEGEEEVSEDEEDEVSEDEVSEDEAEQESWEDLLERAETASRRELEEIVKHCGMQDEGGKPLRIKGTEQLRQEVIGQLQEQIELELEAGEGAGEEDGTDSPTSYSEEELQGKTVEELTEILETEFNLPVVAKKVLPGEGVYVPKAYTAKQRKALLVSAILAEQSGGEEAEA